MDGQQQRQASIDQQIIANLRQMLDDASMRIATLAALADIRAARIRELETQLADADKETDNA